MRVATWSQADVDKLRAAIVALASGEAVQTVAYDGPPKRQVTYHSADLGQMRSLLAEMSRDVAKSRSRRLAQWRKGFRG